MKVPGPSVVRVWLCDWRLPLAVSRLTGALLSLALLGSPALADLPQARRELQARRFAEAAELSHRAPGLEARLVEIEALTESERLGEAWQVLRALPRSAFDSAEFYRLRGELASRRGDADAVRKDFAEALRRSRRPALLRCREAAALSRCDLPQEARQLWLEAAPGVHTPEEVTASQWTQVQLAARSSEPAEGLAALAVLEQLSPHSPGRRGEVCLWRARLALQLGNIPSARSAVESAFALFQAQPNRAGLLAALQQAVPVERKENTRAGRAWLRQLCLRARATAYPELQLWSYLVLGSLAANGDGDYAAARRLVEEAYRRFPKDWQRIVTLGMALYLHERSGADPAGRIPWLQERWQLLRKGRPRQPEDALYREAQPYVYHAQLAICRLRREPSVALALFQQARAEAPGDAERLEILRTQLVEGSDASALPLVHEGLGEALRLAASGGRELETLEALVEIAASRTRTRELWVDYVQPLPESAMGIIRYRLLQRPDALRQLELRYQERWERADRDKRLGLACGLANLLALEERYQEAVWALDRGLREGSRWLEGQGAAREQRARLERALGRWDEALADLEQARALFLQEGSRDPLRRAALVDVTRALYLRTRGRAAEALQAAREGLGERLLIPRERVALLYQEGAALLELGRSDESLAVFQQALELNDDPLTRLALLMTRAPTERAAGRTDAARATWREAYQLVRQMRSLIVRDVGLKYSSLLPAEEARAVLLETAAAVDELGASYPEEGRQLLSASPATEVLRKRLRELGWSGWAWDHGVVPAAPDETARFQADCTLARSQTPAWDARLPLSLSDFASHREDAAGWLQFVLSPHETSVLAAGGGHLRLYRRRVEEGQVREWLRQAWDSPEARRQLERLLLPDFPRARWIVLPTEELWYLPWAALQDDEGHFLCTRSQVTVGQPDDRVGPPERWLLSTGAEASLPESRRELEAIHALFPQARALTGPQATRSAFLEGCRQAALIHVASHSRVFPGDLNRSSLDLADGPMPLSELYSLRLPGSLVVLSSCSGAVGEALPGKEAGSLAAAWRAAGASQVIASLRPVDDEATRGFFELFYRRLRDGDAPAEALRATQAQLSASGRLIDWAPFQLFGR